MFNLLYYVIPWHLFTFKIFYKYLIYLIACTLQTQKLDEVYQLMLHDVDDKSQEILTSAIDTIIKHIGYVCYCVSHSS